MGRDAELDPWTKGVESESRAEVRLESNSDEPTTGFGPCCRRTRWAESAVESAIATEQARAPGQLEFCFEWSDLEEAP